MEYDIWILVLDHNGGRFGAELGLGVPGPGSQGASLDPLSPFLHAYIAPVRASSF